jgi:DNA-directed RNA polymerase subunit omega
MVACARTAHELRGISPARHIQLQEARMAKGIINPPIDELLDKVDSKYQLVIYASKRARQINDYYTDIHEGSMFDNVGPLVDATIEDKPLSVALHEIHADKLMLTKDETAEA